MTPQSAVRSLLLLPCTLLLAGVQRPTGRQVRHVAFIPKWTTANIVRSRAILRDIEFYIGAVL